MEENQPMIVKVVADPADESSLLLDLGIEFCEKMGWQPGDAMQWIDNKDGSWTLTKLKN